MTTKYSGLASFVRTLHPYELKSIANSSFPFEVKIFNFWISSKLNSLKSVKSFTPGTANLGLFVMKQLEKHTYMRKLKLIIFIN